MEFLEGDHLDFRLFSSSKVFVIGCCMYVDMHNLNLVTY